MASISLVFVVQSSLRKRDLMMVHRFSIGFIPGEFSGQSKTFKLFLLKTLVTTFDVWRGDRSRRSIGLKHLRIVPARWLEDKKAKVVVYLTYLISRSS